MIRDITIAYYMAIFENELRRLQKLWFASVECGVGGETVSYFSDKWATGVQLFEKVFDCEY